MASWPISRVPWGGATMNPYVRTTVLTLGALLIMGAGLSVAADAPVAEAAKAHDMAAVRDLVAKGHDVNAALPDGATALHWAAHWNEPEAVESLLKAGASPNARNDYGIVPLSLACTNRSGRIVLALLAAGADPNAASDTGESALMTCSYTGTVEGVRAMVERGANVNARENLESQTALMWAASQGHQEILAILLKAGAELGATSRVREHFVCYTTQCGNTDFSRIDERAQGRVKKGGYTALLFAARQGDIDSVRLLLDAGAPLEAQVADGYTPLLMALHSGHTELSRYLLDRGANPNASELGYSALHIAVLRGNLEMVNMLLDAGADINSTITRPAPMERFTDKWMVLPLAVLGHTPMQLAAKYLETPIMKRLIEAGANPDEPTEDGTTPLMAVAGVNINRNGSTDRRGRSVDVAIVTVMMSDEAAVMEGVQVLVEAGDSIGAVNRNGDTALHGAAGLGMPKVYQYLVDHGADPEFVNKRGQSPKDLLDAAMLAP